MVNAFTIHYFAGRLYNGQVKLKKLKKLFRKWKPRKFKSFNISYSEKK